MHQMRFILTCFAFVIMSSYAIIYVFTFACVLPIYYRPASIASESKTTVNGLLAFIQVASLMHCLIGLTFGHFHLKSKFMRHFFLGSSILLILCFVQVLFLFWSFIYLVSAVITVFEMVMLFFISLAVYRDSVSLDGEANAN